MGLEHWTEVQHKKPEPRTHTARFGIFYFMMRVYRDRTVVFVDVEPHPTYQKWRWYRVFDDPAHATVARGWVANIGIAGEGVAQLLRGCEWKVNKE